MSNDHLHVPSPIISVSVPISGQYTSYTYTNFLWIESHGFVELSRTFPIIYDNRLCYSKHIKVIKVKMHHLGPTAN